MLRYSSIMIVFIIIWSPVESCYFFAALVPGASDKLGDWVIEYELGVWLIEYALFLHGLAQRQRLRKKQNLAQR